MWWLTCFLLMAIIYDGDAIPVNKTELQRTAEMNIYQSEYIECKITTNVTSTNIEVMWTRNGKKFKTYAVSTNQDSHKLELRGTPDEVGNYTCVMTDVIGTITSKSKEIKPTLTISSRLIQETIVINSQDDHPKSFKLQCIVMSSFPKQTNVTFTREPNALNPNRTTIKTIQNGTRTIYELKLERMSDEDTGNYFCEVRNALKTQRQFVETLSVQVKCSDENTNSQWKCPNSELCISKLLCQSYDDCGRLYCEVPEPVTNARIVHCSYDAVEIRWDKNAYAKSFSIEVAEQDKMKKYFASITNDVTLRGLNNNTVLNFTIHAKNDFGQCLKGVTLSCKTPRMVKPSTVGTVELLNTPIGFQFIWDPAKDDGMENKQGVLKYNVEYCKNNTQCRHQCHVECKNFTTTKTSMQLNEIVEFDSKYIVQVTPVNKAGQSGESKTIILFPPKYNTSIRHGSSTSLNILCLIGWAFYMLQYKYMNQ